MQRLIDARGQLLHLDGYSGSTPTFGWMPGSQVWDFDVLIVFQFKFYAHLQYRCRLMPRAVATPLPLCTPLVLTALYVHVRVCLLGLKSRL